MFSPNYVYVCYSETLAVHLLTVCSRGNNQSRLLSFSIPLTCAEKTLVIVVFVNSDYFISMLSLVRDKLDSAVIEDYIRLFSKR